jgi:epimerase transport system membrane fusion protein
MSDNPDSTAKTAKPLVKSGARLPSSQPAKPKHVEGEIVETDIENPRRVGLTIAFLVFGVFGVWSVVMPIEGAAHAPGIITAKSSNRLVQHLEGGIVKEIRARNGDHVEAGDVLLVMDNTQPLAQLEINNTQLAALTALEARLIAERDGLDTVNYPAELRNGIENARNEIDSQNQVFMTRKQAFEGEIAVLEQRIEQLQSQIAGLKALHASKLELAASFADELVDIRSLLEERFAEKQRLRDVERSHAIASGEAAELLAQIASTEIQIGETRLQIIQTRNRFQTEVADQLANTQTQIKDIRERNNALRDIVNRTDVRSPVAGIVNKMQAHTEGGVIRGGEPIAEIVPVSDELIVEGHVSPADIDRVVEGQEAKIRFSSFSSKQVKVATGKLIGLSADTIRDQNGPPYYLARVEISPESLADLQDVELIPGMPAEVMIATGSRTFMQYVMKPFSNALARSLRED